jgi:hypothetical protein
MAGLRPGHPRLGAPKQKTWMPGTRPGMTIEIFATKSSQALKMPKNATQLWIT